MKTPIVLITFNRPDFTRRLLSTIQKVKPKKLYIISDGPRAIKKFSDEHSINKTRKMISEMINWKCQIHTKFESTNLGCRKSVSRGLDWVFSFEETAIILEDDCIPDVTFFRFCEELLEKFRSNSNVLMVSGSNIIPNIKVYESYLFSRYSSIWGWATWKRAWQYYQKAEKIDPEELETYVCKNIPSFSPSRLSAIKKTLEGSIDTWDYIWQLALLIQGGLCVIPKNNLVTNIGFGRSATHTRFHTSFSHLPTQPMRFPLVHQNTIEENYLFEKSMWNKSKKTSLILDIVTRFFLSPFRKWK